MYQLLARMFGTNNMPNSSNMCHESTSVALPESIGGPVGTVTLEDFPQTECMLFFGENVGTNAPRMLHDLQQASKRDVPIVTFNPIRERGLERFQNPLSLGHGAWFGLAAYAAALSQLHWFRGDVILPALFSIAFVAVAAALSGALILRRRGVYFSLLTLALTALLFAI